MPFNLKNRPEWLKQNRREFVEKLKLAVGRCEIKNLPYAALDCHEFWLTYTMKQSHELANFILTHPANCVVIEHNKHINQKPSYEDCIKAVRNRPNWIYQKFGFSDFWKAKADFEQGIRKFYTSERKMAAVDFIPKI